MRVKLAGVAVLVVAVVTACALAMRQGEENKGAISEPFSPCIPLARPDLTLGEEAKRARALLLCEQAERAAADTSRDPGALWQALTQAEEATALLVLTASPGALSLRVTDVRSRLLAVQREEADRLLLETRMHQRRGDGAGAEVCLRRLLRLIPDPTHPLHQRVRRELGDW